MSDIKKELTLNMFEERESDQKHPTYDSEMAIYNLIGEGKIDEVKKLMDAEPSTDDPSRGVLSENPLRNAIYHHVVMTALVTRVCISKGLPQDLAYKLSDAYIKKADKLSRIEDVHQVQHEMIETFAEYMSSNNVRNAHSKQIMQCIDYIRQNIHGSITVAELADVVMLNETYLSKLFKKEMGCTVSEYIRNEKIEEACYLLVYTDKTSIEIATDLSFSSHSYFISVFKKVTGLTPKEYRNKNFRKIVN